MPSILRPLTTALFVVVTGLLLSPDAEAQRSRFSAQLFDDDAPGFYAVAGGCYASGVAIQPDLKVVASGAIGKPGDQRMIVARFHADGALDTSFGQKDGETRKGFIEVSVGSDAQGEGIAVDPGTGAIYVVGNADVDDQWNAVVVKLTPDGDLDASFQESGVLLHRFESQVDEGSGFGLQPTWGGDVEVDLDGNVVITGRTGRPGDHEPYVTRFKSNGEMDWTRKHGTAGFDDGAIAISVPLKEPPYKIYTTGFSVITNVIKTFDDQGSVQVGQSSLGFCMRSFGISYDESTDRVVCAGSLGNDLIIRAMDNRPEVIPDIVFKNPFKEQKCSSYGRGIQHLSNGRVAVVGHGRPYDAKDSSERRFQFALYEPDGTLVAYDQPDFGSCAAALDVAVHENSLIAVAGRVLTEEVSSGSANFKMGFVLYNGDGKMVGKPWTFDLIQTAVVEKN